MNARYLLLAVVAFAGPIATSSVALAENEGNNLAAVEVPASTGIYYTGTAMPPGPIEGAEATAQPNVRPVAAAARVAPPLATNRADPQQVAVRR